MHRKKTTECKPSKLKISEVKILVFFRNFVKPESSFRLVNLVVDQKTDAHTLSENYCKKVPPWNRSGFSETTFITVFPF